MTELMNTNEKKYAPITNEARLSPVELNWVGSRVGVNAQAIATTKFLTPGISFNRLYLNSFGIHTQLYKTPHINGIDVISIALIPYDTANNSEKKYAIRAE
jgi:hypothetical protein